jgi:hypothetical protein
MSLQNLIPRRKRKGKAICSSPGCRLTGSCPRRLRGEVCIRLGEVQYDLCLSIVLDLRHERGDLLRDRLPSPGGYLCCLFVRALPSCHRREHPPRPILRTPRQCKTVHREREIRPPFGVALAGCGNPTWPVGAPISPRRNIRAAPASPGSWVSVAVSADILAGTRYAITAAGSSPDGCWAWRGDNPGSSLACRGS